MLHVSLVCGLQRFVYCDGTENEIKCLQKKCELKCVYSNKIEVCLMFVGWIVQRKVSK